jgi:hypothetical protein
MKVPVLMLLILVCGQTLLADPAPAERGGADIPFVEKSDLNRGSRRGYATLTLNQTTLKLGERFSADIRFTNTSGGDCFYNPLFSRLTFLPARLAIFDSRKAYLGDLLLWEGGSWRGPSAMDWQWVPGDCYVGTIIGHLTAGYVPGTESGVLGHPLPAGEYYLQVIYFNAFIAGNPERMGSNPLKDLPIHLAEFQKNFDRGELFRSNVVRVVFAE